LLKGVSSAWLHGLAATFIGLLFLAVSFGSPVTYKVSELAAVILEYPERPALWTRRLVSEGVSWAGGQKKLQERVRDLEFENARLRATLQERPDVVVSPAPGLVHAWIDARPPAFWWTEVRVGRGSNDGVKVGMPALWKGFLAGRVSRVFAGHSWVDLLTSTGLMVPVVVEETRDLGVLTGDGRGGIQLLYIPEEKGLRSGMRLSTAPVSDILPAGLPVGEISDAPPTIEDGFRVYRVLPGVDFSVMDSLLVMTGGRP